MIYVDTNIWLNYINAQRKGDRFPKSKEADELMKYIKKNNGKIFFSFFNYIELSSRLTEQLISLRLLGEGCCLFELGSERKGEKINQAERKILESEIKEITDIDFVYFDPVENNKAISSDEMEKIYKLISYDIEMPDAFHVIFALQNNCSSFITKDMPLFNRIQLAKKDSDFLKKLHILNPKAILNAKSKAIKF